MSGIAQNIWDLQFLNEHSILHKASISGEQLSHDVTFNDTQNCKTLYWGHF